MATSFQLYCRNDEILFTSDSLPVKVYCSFLYGIYSSVRRINVFCSSVDHWKDI